uniref:Uncharacterized protein n=1 Tax=viral metagenome TaxID=1070528 RepID=A0A6M3MA35_9ZZZZ
MRAWHFKGAAKYALTEEKFKEYLVQLKRGEIELDELIAGLMAVHGATRIEGAMTPREFLDYLGISIDQIDMSDELRKQFKK